MTLHQSPELERLRAITRTLLPNTGHTPVVLTEEAPTKKLGRFAKGDIVRIAVGSGPGIWYAVAHAGLTAREAGAPLGAWMWTQHEVTADGDLWAVSDDPAAGDAYVTAYRVGHISCDRADQ